MNRIPLLTQDELILVKDYILLPILLKALERDIKVITVVPLKLPTIYVKGVRKIQEKIIDDIHLLKRELWKHGLKVFDTCQTKNGVEADYVCRGYHHKFTMGRRLIKAEVEKKLCIYIGMDITDVE